MISWHNLQPADDKEIISVLTYSDEAPESATAGDLYIDSENNQPEGIPRRPMGRC